MDMKKIGLKEIMGSEVSEHGGLATITSVTRFVKCMKGLLVVCSKSICSRTKRARVLAWCPIREGRVRRLCHGDTVIHGRIPWGEAFV
jgi:hypothetical protein